MELCSECGCRCLDIWTGNMICGKTDKKCSDMYPDICPYILDGLKQMHHFRKTINKTYRILFSVWETRELKRSLLMKDSEVVAATTIASAKKKCRDKLNKQFFCFNSSNIDTSRGTNALRELKFDEIQVVSS